MGRREVFCNYPDHGVSNQLPPGAQYRVFHEGNLVVCEDCWRDKMIVEDLLKMLNIGFLQTQVGLEK